MIIIAVSSRTVCCSVRSCTLQEKARTLTLRLLNSHTCGTDMTWCRGCSAVAHDFGKKQDARLHKFSHEVQFTFCKEYHSAYKNSCITLESSGGFTNQRCGVCAFRRQEGSYERLLLSCIMGISGSRRSMQTRC